MTFNERTKKHLAKMLAVITIMSSIYQPAIAFAADKADAPPELSEVMKELSEDEIVKVKDYEVKMGSDFDASKDFDGIEYTDKVSIKLHSAVNKDGDKFSTDNEDTYTATYYVTPKNVEHPEYQVSRNLIVKKPVTEKIVESVKDAIKGNETEDEKAFDKAIEEAENQQTVDPKTGITLSEVLEAAGDEGIELTELEIGESVSFDMPVMLAAASETGKQKVDITRGDWYYYADYGLGTYRTSKFTVKWGDIKATAYCVQPSKVAPDDGKYEITKLKDSKMLAKVCYYGTKASEDNGFFDQEHPGFSAGKKYVIVHIAAAYANGSSDWDSGTNATGRALAKELYNYCASMPDIPDVDMSFSEADTKAYVDGNSQRTKTITFNADELQTVTMKLPAEVKLVNVTTGKTTAAGASVELSGGTKFYLVAPLNYAEDVAETFKITMKGSITKEYSAYKISTGGSEQDLALVFGEGVDDEKYVDFKVTWTKECYVQITKKDSVTSNELAGAVYGIYSDIDCTKLIAKMPPTDAKGQSKVTFDKDKEVVYLKEISAPANYVIDAKSYNVTVSIGKTSTKNVVDKSTKASIKLSKQDSETGADAQGDATFKGAVYGLYAREDIVHPDGKTGVLFNAGDEVLKMTTDENGEATALNLFLGKYYIKEITPPEGYLLDKTEYDVECSYEGDQVPVIERSVTSPEDVIKQPFQIIKVANNGKTDADLLAGAGFTAYLKSKLPVGEDGAYDFENAEPVVITADGQTEMFTDEMGYAVSIPLPYGEYIVRETTTPHNFDPVKDFEVKITENKPNVPQIWRVLLDDEFSAKLKIIKTDGETTKAVLVKDTEFKVFDVKANKYVEQVTTYPSVVKHESYFTNEEGFLIMPKALKPGEYRIEEVAAPNGYVLGEAVTVTIDSNEPFQVIDISDDNIFTVDFVDEQAKGKLTIVKTGEVYTPNGKYPEAGGPLEGVEFSLCAAEDIYTADKQVDEDGNRIIKYAKDQIVTMVSTDAEGKATIENIPLGKYYVQETKTIGNYILDTTKHEVTFEYADQNTAVIEQTIEIVNRTTHVQISKQDMGGKELPGAQLTLRDIDGNVIELWTSGNKPHMIDALKPGKYVLHEEAAPKGYKIANDMEFEVLETSEIQHVVMVDEAENVAKKPNVPKTGDDMKLLLWILLAAGSAAGLGALIVATKMKRKN